MNVQETLLKERIDPYLSDRALTSITRRALQTGTEDRLTADVRGYEVLTGGCWNRVIAVRCGEREAVLKISPHRRDEHIIREFTVLREFAAGTDLPVPTHPR